MRRLFPTLALLLTAAVADPVPLERILGYAERVDALLGQDLASHDLEINTPVDDATFVRRAYLVLVGRVPTVQEVRDFLAADPAARRTELVERLSFSPGQSSHLFNQWGDRLRLRTNHFEYGVGWHIWLRDAVDADMPYDEFVRKMLTTTSHAAIDPAAGYYLRDRNMLLDNVANTAQVFLGQQIGCAQCHDDPFGDFTQREFYELAAFSSGVRYRSREADETARRAAVHAHPSDTLEGRELRRARRKLRRELNPAFRLVHRNATHFNAQHPLKYPDDYQYDDAEPGSKAEPRLPVGHKTGDIAADERLDAFAGWLTSPDHPLFTKSIVNRLWKQTFGHGLVDPVDSWDEDTEPSHAKVLEVLVEAMHDVGFRQKELLRILAHTRLFAAGAHGADLAAGERHLFTGPILRRMSAEQLHDSILTIAKGNVDADTTDSFRVRWANYQLRQKALFDMQPEELLARNRAMIAARDDIARIQGEIRDLRKKIVAARKAGEREKLRAFREKIEALSLQRERLNMLGKGSKTEPVGMSMMQMRKVRRQENKDIQTRRASERPQPAGRGHFLGQFGGSDRETPDAATTHASLPQALTLLNGVPAGLVLQRESQLQQDLRELPDYPAKLDHIFLAFYATEPTAAERELLKGTSPAELIRAILTSKRFSFIQ